MKLAELGGTENGGVSRLALSDEEIEARRLLIAWADEIGLSVFTDKISNLFFRLEGSDPNAEPVLTGSHIDTQPKGGKFDGAFGVVAGIESLQAIKESGCVLTRSIEVVAWLNEEGSRFSPGMMGSEAFTGRRSMADILKVEDEGGTTTLEALERTQEAFKDIERRQLGFPVASYIEAHIEQGPILEKIGKPVGVVTGIQGSRRFRVYVNGAAAHAGTEPMSERKDALMAALDMIGAMRTQFADDTDHTMFTVGRLETSPNVPSVVPAETFFTIDIRHPEWTILKQQGDSVERLCQEYRGPCAVEVNEIMTSESLEFPKEVRSCISESAKVLGIDHEAILSKAGHDARQMHYHCPTGMIFSPCKDGLSHNEAESCEPSDLAAGTRVLAVSIAKLAT
jgi:N-carbamoyl-L-amino-acid hydrolase